MRKGEARSCTLLEGEGAAVALAGEGPLLPNEAGRGYYRFELPAAEWDALIAVADTLPGGEAQALADSLAASFAAGRASLAQLIALAAKRADNPDSYAFGDSGALLAALDPGDFLAGEAEEAYEALWRHIYAPKLAGLGFDPTLGAYEGEDPETAQKRQQLVSRMAFEARDADVHAILAKAAQDYLAGDESALDPAFLNHALSVHVEEGDLAHVQALADRALSSQDPVFRPAALGSLADKGDEAIARWILDEFDDPRLRPTERLSQISGVVANSDTRDIGLAWVRAHFDELLASSSGIFIRRGVPRMLTGFCSVEDADRIAEEFAPPLAGTAAELSLARRIERIRNCGALVEARGNEIVAAVLSPPGAVGE